MPDESYPLGIEDKSYYLRFEDRDVIEIERQISLFVAFHPSNRTYENAALFMWRGLRTKTESGELAYAIQQGDAGKAAAIAITKEFTRQFPGIIGIALLYGYIEKALVVAGWFGEEKAEEPAPVPAPEPETEKPKNSLPPTKKAGRKQRLG